MPNVKGPAAATAKGIAANIRAERASGKPQKQSVAIAMSYAGKSKQRKRGRRRP